MPETIGFEQQFRLTGPDGTVLYNGSGEYHNVFPVTSAEASATILQDEAVRITTASTIVSPSVNAAATLSVTKVERTASAVQTLMCGVSSFGPILAGKVGLLVGAGSIVPVRSTATGAVGVVAQSSGTAGMVASGGAATLCTNLGIIIKAVAAYNGVNMVGVLVNPT